VALREQTFARENSGFVGMTSSTEGGAEPNLPEVWEHEDWPRLVRIARSQPSLVVRYLCARLYSEDDAEKWKAVHALGRIAGEVGILSDRKVVELLRRFFWWLNDESGAVPYGIAEAIGELLGVRPSMRGRFLPMLCAMAHSEDTCQSGAIERGVFWALGRVGPEAARCSPEAVAALRLAARHHRDPATRETARVSLAQLESA
jgi:hypothetical protein